MAEVVDIMDPETEGLLSLLLLLLSVIALCRRLLFSDCCEEIDKVEDILLLCFVEGGIMDCDLIDLLLLLLCCDDRLLLLLVICCFLLLEVVEEEELD